MTREDKELLLKDLCGRLPYGVILDVDTTDWREPQGHIKVKIEGVGILFKDMSLIVNGSYYGDNYKPYLRSMSSMTEDEKHVLVLFNAFVEPRSIELKIDFYNRQHLDYRGLIEKGLAVEVTKENNPYKEFSYDNRNT